MRGIYLFVILVGMLNTTAKADTDFVVSIHPISTIALLPFGIYYGEVTMEYSAFGIDGITTSISILHRKESSIDTFDFFYSRFLDTTNYEKNQISVFVGKKIYNNPIYIQPTINFGYYHFVDRKNNSNNINNIFMGALAYCGAKYSYKKMEYGFDFGAGVRILGKNQFDAFERLLLDANANIGYRF